MIFRITLLHDFIELLSLTKYINPNSKTFHSWNQFHQSLDRNRPTIYKIVQLTISWMTYQNNAIKVVILKVSKKLEQKRNQSNENIKQKHLPSSSESLRSFFMSSFLTALPQKIDWPTRFTSDGVENSLLGVWKSFKQGLRSNVCVLKDELDEESGDEITEGSGKVMDF